MTHRTPLPRAVWVQSATVGRALLAAVLLAAVLLLGLPRAGHAVLRDEIVPEGVWLLRAAVSQRTEERAFSRLNVEAPLLEYVVPAAEDSAQITGEITRDVQRSALLATYGLSDGWNLSLTLPFVRVEQTSTLATESADPAVQAAVGRLASRDISGTGQLRLMSLHRPVFTDSLGIVLGLGYATPGDDLQGPWAGRSTLRLDDPTPRIVGVFHLTFYPLIERSRFDVRLGLELGEDKTVALPAGDRASLNTGNRGQFAMGWHQEFGPFLTGLTFLHTTLSQSSLDGLTQGDSVTETALRLRVGYGNLDALEAGPIAFPYRVVLQFHQTVQGFNTPLREELTLSLTTYF